MNPDELHADYLEVGREHYLGIVRREMRRLVSLQDREPYSLTYGSFDRTFWCWKFTDFAGARFQEGTYALAHLYAHSFTGNDFAGNEKVLAWVRAGLMRWKTLQYRDGSFDEAYPFEHSLAATAFTGFYVGEAFLLVQDRIPAAERVALVRAFARAGDWLCKNDERHGILSNHLAAAAAALNTIHRICRTERYGARSNHFIDRILRHQSDEGWYEEYGGADPGYQTHCTFYLAWIWKHTGDIRLLESLGRSVTFLKYFVHPNGSLGGEYASRNTEFYFPAGLEILAGELSDASAIAIGMRQAVTDQAPAGLAAMDCYNYFPLLNNYLFAAEAVSLPTEPPAALPWKDPQDTCFPDAGLLIKGTSAYHSVTGLSKGGVVYMYDRATRHLLARDCTYWVRIGSGRVLSPQSFNRRGTWQREGRTVHLEADFAQVDQRVMNASLFMGFRVFTLTLGRLRWFAYWIKNLLVRVLVRRRKVYPLKLHRLIHYEDDRILIQDRIWKSGPIEIDRLQYGGKFCTIHMGSSRYFTWQELDDDDVGQEIDTSALSAGGELRLEHVLSAGPAGSRER